MNRHLLILLAMLVSSAASSQNEWIAIQRAQAKLHLAQEEARRVNDLAEQGLVSEAEVSRAKVALRMAELDYREALWEFEGLEKQVIVAGAERKTEADGLDHVTLELALPRPSLPHGAGVEGVLGALGVNNLRVSLMDGNVVVGFPYTAVIPHLAPGTSATVTFKLLRPVPNPTVQLEYHGRKEKITVLLQNTGVHRAVRVAVAQPSLEVAFGGEARFAFSVEPLVRTGLTLGLSLRGLPSVCVAHFEDKDSGVFLSALHLPPGASSRRLILRVKLPAQEGPSVTRGRPLRFEAVFTEASNDAEEESIPLEVTPRGTPRLELIAASWLAEVKVGETDVLGIQVRNTGTAPAVGITLEIEHPAGLALGVDPSRIERLPVGGMERFQVTIQSDGDLAPGDYVVRLRARAENLEVTETEGEGRLRLRLTASLPLLPGMVLLGVLLALAALGTIILRRTRIE